LWNFYFVDENIFEHKRRRKREEVYEWKLFTKNPLSKQLAKLDKYYKES
jgi:hypothetical protein